MKTTIIQIRCGTNRKWPFSNGDTSYKWICWLP